MKHFFFVLFILLSVFCNAQNADQSPNFQRDSIRFSSFEAEHGRYIQTPNVNMHYLEWGKPSDPTLIWVHGTYSNGTEIIEIVDSIVESGYRVIAIDYYGHGKTPIPEKEVSLYHVADDIHFLMNQLNISSCFLAGWSRGGSIATAFYDIYPNMVDGIVLVDGGAANWIRNRQLLPKDVVESRFEEMEKYLEKTYFPSLKELYAANYSNEYPLWNVYNFSYFGKEDKGWCINPNLQQWLEDDSIELHRKKLYKPSTSGLFHQSTVFMLPEVIYRNLNTRLLIIDPLKDDDEGFFAYSNEYKKIKAMHPDLVSILEYPNATHGVLYEESDRVKNDIIDFLKK